MPKTIVKNNPEGAIVIISGDSANETITLNELALAGKQTASSPVVYIRALHIWTTTSSAATVTRNSVVLYKTDQNQSLRFENFADTREAGQNITVTLGASGGTVILDLAKKSGYGDTQQVAP